MAKTRESGMILEVSAGPHDRKDAVVSWACGGGCASNAAHTLHELNADGSMGTAVPCQCLRDTGDGDDAIGSELVWIVRELQAGETKRYAVARVDDGGGGCDDGVCIEIVEGQQADIKVGGEPFTSYIVKDGIARPYCYPVLGPGGAEITELAKTDHPHHKSMYVAQGEVNGFDNWSEIDGHASTVNQGLTVLSQGPVFGDLLSVSDWVSPKGDNLLQEITRIRTYNLPDSGRLMEWDITWFAAYRGVFFGDTKEAGTLSVRMIETAHGRNGGTIRNSYGGVGETECWGKQAEWVDYYGSIESGVGGLTIMDHPDNLRFPTTWHVRDYGLFTVNQWGLHDFTGDWSQRGDYALGQGDALNFLFRVYIHAGDTDEADVASKYVDFIYPPEVAMVEG